MRIEPPIPSRYLFSHIDIGLIAIGIADLILKSKGSRGDPIQAAAKRARRNGSGAKRSNTE